MRSRREAKYVFSIGPKKLREVSQGGIETEGGRRSEEKSQWTYFCIGSGLSSSFLLALSKLFNREKQENVLKSRI